MQFPNFFCGLAILAVNLYGIHSTGHWFAICREKRLHNTNNTVLREYPVASTLECASACKDNSDCFAVNAIRQLLGYTCQMMSGKPFECDTLQEDKASVYIKLEAQQCVHGGEWDMVKQNCGTCNVGFAGTFCERHIIDCFEGMENGQKGYAQVLLQPTESTRPFHAKCDFNWGSTYLESRKDRDNYGDFNQNWSEYKEGFGNIADSFFLGLEKIHLLTTHLGERYLKVQADNDTTRFQSHYFNFRLDNEANKYTMHYDSYGSDLVRRGGDGFNMGAPTASINHAPFCTPDNDCNSCAKDSSSGWWFNTNCAYINLHVPYSGSEIVWPRDSADNTTENIVRFDILLYRQY